MDREEYKRAAERQTGVTALKWILCVSVRDSVEILYECLVVAFKGPVEAPCPEM